MSITDWFKPQQVSVRGARRASIRQVARELRSRWRAAHAKSEPHRRAKVISLEAERQKRMAGRPPEPSRG